ncbi:hypothetical protein [Streptomyces olivoverticillatus]|nr:hypothetical protein [Streptomyces olivoverticillatus]
MPSTTPAPPVTSFTGAFEAHLTVRADAVRLEAHAAAHGLKFTHIVLERGRTPSQPMLTLHRRGPLPAVREAVEDAARALQDAGFEVVRTKIEAAPWVEGVPDTDEEAAVLGPRYYFEHHIKLLIAPGAALPRLAPAHTAHLSRNARRIRTDGRTERFVTQRCRLVGRRTAQARLLALTADLGAHEIISTEQEFVIHDSDESLDAGWITEESARA